MQGTNKSRNSESVSVQLHLAGRNYAKSEDNQQLILLPTGIFHCLAGKVIAKDGPEAHQQSSQPTRTQVLAPARHIDGRNLF